MGVKNQCGGKFQSPIDIETHETTYEASLGLLKYFNYDKRLLNAHVLNNGHTVLVAPKGNSSATVTAKGLSGVYRFNQFHFHWGSDSTIGTEHHIDGEAHAMEMHLVHTNTKYSTAEEAYRHPDGLLVVGVLFEASRQDNRALNSVVHSLDQMLKLHTRRAKLSKAISLADLLPRNPRQAYFYKGSLTTPPCAEAVTMLSPYYRYRYPHLSTWPESWSWHEYRCIAHNSCGGRQQSPVNIETLSVLHDIGMKPLVFHGHDVPLRNFTVHNDWPFA
ncbi:hypothetical protein HPB50_009061 [Hyalomma asiaticum]|uniref:Uncharacterized protein n=1 Tax=Hyalomma asiaticum TaxID=266040 RepID=A0ACB7SDF5_HYAAI|nr:hypothetical protein HPB50_009061 [Hyalomma asiaticum]